MEEGWYFMLSCFPLAILPSLHLVIVEVNGYSAKVKNQLIEALGIPQCSEHCSLY